MEHIHVSLTTISNRINKILPVIDSLLSQSYQSFDVTLFLSNSPYLLDDGIKDLPIELIEFQKKDNFFINFTENTGPFRKLLPLLESKMSSPDTIIVTVDDDVCYPSNFLSTLYIANLIHNCPIGYRGRKILLQDGNIAPYSQWKTTNLSGKSCSNCPTGKDGILYRVKYFHNKVLKIQDAIKYCQTTDDIWFKWHTAANRYPSVLLFDNLSQSFPPLDPGDKVTLFDQFNKHNKKNNQASNNDQFIDEVTTYLKQKIGFSFNEYISAEL